MQKKTQHIDKSICTRMNPMTLPPLWTTSYTNVPIGLMPTHPAFTWHLRYGCKCEQVLKNTQRNVNGLNIQHGTTGTLLPWSTWPMRVLLEWPNPDTLRSRHLDGHFFRTAYQSKDLTTTVVPYRLRILKFGLLHPIVTPRRYVDFYRYFHGVLPIFSA